MCFWLVLFGRNRIILCRPPPLKFTHEWPANRWKGSSVQVAIKYWIWSSATIEQLLLSPVKMWRKSDVMWCVFRVLRFLLGHINKSEWREKIVDFCTMFAHPCHKQLVSAPLLGTLRWWERRERRWSVEEGEAKSLAETLIANVLHAK
jgi:hypothetical protein